MKRKRHTPQQVVRKLQEGEAALGAGRELAAVCRMLCISVQAVRFPLAMGGRVRGLARAPGAGLLDGGRGASDSRCVSQEDRSGSRLELRQDRPKRTHLRRR